MSDRLIDEIMNGEGRGDDGRPDQRISELQKEIPSDGARSSRDEGGTARNADKIQDDGLAMVIFDFIGGSCRCRCRWEGIPGTASDSPSRGKPRAEGY